MVSLIESRQRLLTLQIIWIGLGQIIVFLSHSSEAVTEDCRLVPVLHVLQTPGCNAMTIPSFACIGKCNSYVQVSGSKIWQMERSCMCCQESGEREATVTLTCPNAPPGSSRYQKVVTRAPVDCMCRPCTTLEEGSVLPQEIAGFLNTDGSSQYSAMMYP